MDWAAHLGGLLTGLSVGLVLFSAKIRSVFWAFMWSVTGFVTTVAGFAIAFDYLFTSIEIHEETRDVCEYYQQFFDDYECHCRLLNNDDDV